MYASLSKHDKFRQTHRVINKDIIMNKIVKKDGYVFLVKENDAYGRFPTYYNMGKDPDDPRWEDKPKKTKKSEE